ncbi:MAG: hypothetical protein H6707_04780 [Deltaproteobacteria bacterium]|nr:hypothetical protein [Deltaproteobacteria bacterium]
MSRGFQWGVAAIGLLLVTQPTQAAKRTRFGVGPITASKAVSQTAKRAKKQLVQSMKGKRSVETVNVRSRGTRTLRCLQTPRCARQLAKRSRVRYVVAGHMEALDRRVHIDLWVVDGKDGRVIVNKSFARRSTARLAQSVAAVASRLVGKALRSKPSAPTAGAGALRFEPEKITRSEAELASAVLEARDTEDPDAKAEASLALDPAEKTSPTKAPRIEVRLDAVKQDNDRGIWSKGYWPAWTSAGVGVAALSTAAIFGAISARANKNAQNAQYQPEAWTQRDKAQKNATIANVMFAVGGAALTASTIMFYLTYKQERKRQQRGLKLDLAASHTGGQLFLTSRF